jgi:exodeoxyribonuclease V alpha subunit
VPQASAKVGRGRPQFGFEHGEANPLDGRIFVVEEASMVDVNLFAAVVSAVPLGSLLLIVGDADQLPSVGPGSVLRDLIAAGIPTATLTEILRSDGGGTVVKACHAIREGQTPTPADRLELPTANWIHVEAGSPEAIADAIVAKVAQVQAGTKLGLDPIWDVQVISAQHAKAGFGCDALNDRLSGLLNTRPEGPVGDSADLRFRVGDKVIRRKNGKVDELKPCLGGRCDWEWAAPYNDRPARWSIDETTVVNGDMGVVEDVVIGKGSAHVVVRFRNPDRLCRMPLGSCHLQRAYAITVHAAQGSGYPYVIVPVHSSFYFDEREGRGIWCRELVYTALSRAEMILVTVGDLSSVRLAIGRRTLHKRRTRLVERIVASRREEAERGDRAAAAARLIEAAQQSGGAGEAEDGSDLGAFDDFTIPGYTDPAGTRELVTAAVADDADPYDFTDLPF